MCRLSGKSLNCSRVYFIASRQLFLTNCKEVGTSSFVSTSSGASLLGNSGVGKSIALNSGRGFSSDSSKSVVQMMAISYQEGFYTSSVKGSKSYARMVEVASQIGYTYYEQHSGMLTLVKVEEVPTVKEKHCVLTLRWEDGSLVKAILDDNYPSDLPGFGLEIGSQVFLSYYDNRMLTGFSESMAEKRFAGTGLKFPEVSSGPVRELYSVNNWDEVYEGYLEGTADYKRLMSYKKFPSREVLEIYTLLGVEHPDRQGFYHFQLPFTDITEPNRFCVLVLGLPDHVKRTVTCKRFIVNMKRKSLYKRGIKVGCQFKLTYMPEPKELIGTFCYPLYREESFSFGR